MSNALALIPRSLTGAPTRRCASRYEWPLLTASIRFLSDPSWPIPGIHHSLIAAAGWLCTIRRLPDSAPTLV
jgi:hypothetical protein